MKLRTKLVAAVVGLALGAYLVRPGEVKATCHGLSYTPQPFAFEQITVSAAAIGFTSATFAPSGQLRAAVALITTETNPIRFRSDGTDPTAAVGHLAAASSQIEVCGVISVNQFKMIRQGAADATAMVTYFR